VKPHTIWLRRIHKWVGLAIGLQFLLWTVSGAMMALLDMEKVAGGPRAEAANMALAQGDAWPAIQRRIGAAQVDGLALRPLLDRPVIEVTSGERTRLFDAATGRPVTIDATMARGIAEDEYVGDGTVARVVSLDELTMAVREHALPIWRVDFDDAQSNSFYVSASSGLLLERRNDSWRTWDFFWMLHNMDYVNRTSFNHPLIIITGFAAVWLAITGLWLLFRTGWRSDFKRVSSRIRGGTN